MDWSSDLAYSVGLITTDGCLSIDGRHIDLTSKDVDQIKTFAKILKLTNKIGKKQARRSDRKRYFRIQFGNVKFYRFLLKIGLTPKKSKTLGKMKIPDAFFADFLRGHLDGDGCTYSYWDTRWKNSFMLYLTFNSASKKHLEWLKKQIVALYNIEGKITYGGKSTYRLRFAKKNSIELIKKLYYRNGLPCLQRKRIKIQKSFEAINVQLTNMQKTSSLVSLYK